MKLKKSLIVVFTSFAFAFVNVNAQQKIDWNGYVQFRFADNYKDLSQFSVRRAKFWVKGNLPFEGNTFGYKVQTIFYSKDKFDLKLQDVLINYKAGNFLFTAGQFVPDFSLQRKQGDAFIPLTERANVIKALIPAAETMARDIGIEIKYGSKLFVTSFGFYNGNGANTLSKEKNFLYVNHSYLRFGNNVNGFRLGYSISYRNAKNLKFTKIFGSQVSFTGSDFRYGFDAKLNTGDFEFQSEFLQANLGGKKARGYYALADYTIANKNLLTISIEKLNDLNNVTNDDPYYTIGYAHLFKGNDIKLSLNDRFQFTDNKTNTLTTLQIQYFFN